MSVIKEIKKKLIYSNNRFVEIDYLKQKYGNNIDSLLKLDSFFNNDLKSFKKIYYSNLNSENPKPTDLNQFSNKLIRASGEIIKDFNWNVLSLSKFSEELTYFIDNEKKIYHLIFSGQYNNAIEILDKTEYICGKSCWGIEIRLLIEQLSNGTEANWKLKSEFLKNSKTEFLRLNVIFSSYKFEIDHSINKFSNSLHEFIDNIPEGDITYEQVMFYFFRIHYLGAGIDTDNLYFLPYLSSNLPIIDKYLIYKRSLFILLKNKKYSEFKNLSKSIIYLYKKINDNDLVNILRTLNYYVATDNIQNNILNHFYNEDYVKSIELSKAYLQDVDSSNIDIILVYIKSLIIEKIPYTPITTNNTLTTKICNILFNIYNKTSSEEENIELVRISNQFSNFSIGLKIFKTLSDNKNIDKELNQNILALGETSAINYSFLKYLNDDELINNHLNISDENNLQKCIYNNWLNKSMSENNNFHMKLNNMKIVSSVDFVETEDNSLLFTEQINYHQDNNYLTSLIKYYNYKFLEKKEDYINYIKQYVFDFLNNKKVLDRVIIENISIILLQSKFKVLEINYNSIEFPIFVYLGISNKIKVKQSIFLFLKANNITTPSDIKFDNFEKDYLIYFLSNICNMDILQLFTNLKSTSEVIDERIKICQILSEIDESNRNKYNDEITSLTQQILIKNVITKIDESKIFINIEKIKKHFLSTEETSKIRIKKNEKIDVNYKFEYERKYKLIEFAYKENLYNLLEPNHNYDLVKQITQLNKLNSIQQSLSYLYVDYYIIIRNYLVYNDEFGLNPYLSTRIRHGTLPNHIRSIYELRHLVTSHSDGAYIQNKYWTKKLNLPIDIDDKIQSALANYSEQIDKLNLHIKNELIQCRTESNNTKILGLFDYTYEINDTYEILQKEIPRFEDFLNLCIEKLIERTVSNLDNIQLNFESNIKHDFIELNNKLLNEIDEIEKTEKVDLNYLKTNINLVTTDIQSYLTNIAKWFSLSDSTIDGKIDLKSLIESSITITKNINPLSKFDIKYSIKNLIKVNGENYNYFVDIFRIIFDNMITRTYVDLPIKLNASLKIEEIENQLNLVFKNNFDIKLLTIISNNMRDIKLNWKNIDKNISEENGTGFSKIKKILNSDLSIFDTLFEYKINDDELTIILKLPNQNLYEITNS